MSDWQEVPCIEEYGPLEIIVREGTEERAVYYVLDGEVELSQRDRQLGYLRAGDFFGLETYLGRSHLNTARAVTRARVSQYDAALFHEIIFHRPTLVETVFTSLVQQFGQLSQIAADVIVPGFILSPEERTFGEDDVVFLEGADDTEFYRLKAGAMTVVKEGVVIGSIDEVGEYFGERSALMGEPREATVVSREPSVVEVFSGHDIEEVMRTYPEIAVKVVKVMIERLKQTNAELTQARKK